MLSDCLRVYGYMAYIKPAVRVVGVGPRCGTPASASASAASNVVHVTRLLMSFIYVSYLICAPPRAHDKSKVGARAPLCPMVSAPMI